MVSTRIDTGGTLDDETVAAANKRLAAMPTLQPVRILNTTALPAEPHTQPELLTIRDATEEYKAQQEPAPDPQVTLESGRKPRSDKGTKRGPIVSKEPEAAMIEGTFTIALTGPQLKELETLAAKLLASVGLEPGHLVVEPAEWLLNARVQKHWRTLIGK
jgi:hypothetical protein